MTKKLSAVIITKNEEINVADCLKSIASVADEIIIADSGSTDQTVEICRKLGAKVFNVDWNGYAETKNYANSLASHNWILSIDADERLSSDLKTNILKVKGQPDEQFFFKFNRRTFYLGKFIRFAGWYPDTKVRLFDRSQAKWIGTIHETLEFDNSIHCQQLKGDCLHYSFQTLDEHIAQINQYSLLSARAHFSRGIKSTHINLIFYPFFHFLTVYFIKLGILEGKRGFIIASMSAHLRFLRYARLFELWQRADKI